MRVLVTNDDGVDAPGLATLARALDDEGHEVVVAAPDRDRSGTGAALGVLDAGDPVRVEARRIAGLDHRVAVAVDGPPAMAVMAARLGAFGDPPDVVVSGVNPGPNCGRSVLHSGTVGAALTASNLGISGIAVSVGAGEPVRFDTAAGVAVAAVGWLADAQPRTVLNCNVPGVGVDELRGVRWAELAPYGTVRAGLAEVTDTELRLELRPTDLSLPPESDTALVAAGYVAVTLLSLVGVAEWQPVAGEVERRLDLGGAGSHASDRAASA